MEKKRGRVITGWRQVAHSKSGLSKSRFSSTKQGKTEPVVEKAANEAWDTEGGHFAEPAKHPVEPPVK